MAKGTAKAKTKVRKQPIKAGTKKPRNIGGIANFKVVLIKNKQEENKA